LLPGVSLAVRGGWRGVGVGAGVRGGLVHEDRVGANGCS